MKRIISIVLIWFLFLGVLGLALEAQSPELKDNPTRTVTVKEGQTLWSIASSINSEGRYNTNYLVSVIEDINDLDSAIINPGQKLKVPKINK